ncbi:chitin-binding lectin 1-like [Glycine soja]|uniref:chitin-binding lectin 1-like n=1 Tax=Glycine soja TaxID=3848 RepID=UPI00103EC6BD|nr:chitin-binding lectin 1-like [Glycine soja]
MSTSRLMLTSLPMSPPPPMPTSSPMLTPIPMPPPPSMPPLLPMPTAPPCPAPVQPFLPPLLGPLPMSVLHMPNFSFVRTTISFNKFFNIVPLYGTAMAAYKL